jgi:hypothetical protein
LIEARFAASTVAGRIENRKYALQQFAVLSAQCRLQ